MLEVESYYSNMLGSGPNQYLQPDYLSPLGSSLDSKSSPLALLAQTCSSIGTDGPSTNVSNKRKPSISSSGFNSLKSTSVSPSDCSSVDDSTSNSNSNKSSLNVNNSKSELKSRYPGNKSLKSDSSLTFPVSKIANSSTYKRKACDISNNSSSGLIDIVDSDNSSEGSAAIPLKPTKVPKTIKESISKKNAESISSRRNSLSPQQPIESSKEIVKKEVEKEQPKHEAVAAKATVSPEAIRKSSSPPSSTISHSPAASAAASISASAAAMEDYNRKLSALASLYSSGGAGGYPSSAFDPLNPAFRPPFLGSPHHPHNPYSSAYSIGTPPHVSYTRTKDASGAEAIIPVCKNPYCTGCQFHGGSGPYHRPASNPSNTSTKEICPFGCISCDHPKLPVASLPHMLSPSLASSLGGLAPSSQLFPPPQQTQQGLYVCNWINGSGYCGERFSSAEDLLLHLKTHTNSDSSPSTTGNPSSSSTDSSALVAAAMLQQQQNMAATAAAISRNSAYSSNPSLNPAVMMTSGTLQRLYSHPHQQMAAAAAAAAAAARYHPYQTSPTSSPAAANILSSYYAAAALYGQKHPGSPSIYQ